MLLKRIASSLKKAVYVKIGKRNLLEEGKQQSKNSKNKKFKQKYNITHKGGNYHGKDHRNRFGNNKLLRCSI